ncbi:hypothetical protein LCGC14_0460820 [marine sediment metagenome]|uniref:Uncharacterized protein n=1 Tax=marine sediment metagenome TaxID=412755 RepID=A0A0F9SF39_9ZZZZ
MKIKFFLAWYDLWIGIYISRKKRKIYICPFLCCVFEISLPRRKMSWEEKKKLWGCKFF